jgi:hypothetical protein
MLADGLVKLEKFAGETVTAIAISNVWEAARHGFAQLLGRGDPKKNQVAERWLAETYEQLTAAATDMEPVRTAQAQRWEGQFADLLDGDPGAEADLPALVQEIASQLPADLVSVADHGVAARRDVNITASRGGTAVGVIHGNVAPPNPTPPGPATR